MAEKLPLTAAVLTPRGRGAVASVAVAGSGALDVVERLFRATSGRPLRETAEGQILYGRFGPLAEEVVVCRQRDDVEIHCHGGQAAVAAVVDALEQCGCAEIFWRDRAQHSTCDAIKAAAIQTLAAATTLRTAAILLDQYQGALRQEIDHCLALIASNEAAAASAVECLQTLAERWRIGRHLTKPFQVVVAGRPNVGKSSLVNVLVGYQRSIVYDQPGTTRDVVSARTAFDGWPVELSDTAGLRQAESAVEAAGVELAREWLAAADLRLLVFDAGQPWQDDDAALVERWPDALIVHSKCDLAEPSDERPGGLCTSALTGLGIAALVRKLGETLVPNPPPPGAAVPFTDDQEACIRDALAALLAGEAAGAAGALRRL